MVYQVRSLGLHGITGYPVSVECDLSGGLPAFTIVGLPDAAVNEARERVRSAVKNCGFTFPVSRITVNLAPATCEEGRHPVRPAHPGGHAGRRRTAAGYGPDCAFVGELSPVRQLRPAARACCPWPWPPGGRASGSSSSPAPTPPRPPWPAGRRSTPWPSVAQLVRHSHRGGPHLPPAAGLGARGRSPAPTSAEVKGQETVKRALEIAAAGGHNLCMVGPPGSGKSMLATPPALHPPRSDPAGGPGGHRDPLCPGPHRPQSTLSSRRRPFRSPTTRVSAMGMAGGGSSPRPGEISLAHNGVLFLDELPEFSKEALETLRQPLEDGRVQISRASGSVTYPSRFMLVCAMNPCKCGWYGHSPAAAAARTRRCRSATSPPVRPLLDRIDLFVEVAATGL
ncbi:MAG: ATP-binding protein [Flavonifractor plautii]